MENSGIIIPQEFDDDDTQTQSCLKTGTLVRAPFTLLFLCVGRGPSVYNVVKMVLYTHTHTHINGYPE